MRDTGRSQPCIGRLSDEQPLLLILEDMHWADRSTRAFVSSARPAVRPQRKATRCTPRSCSPPASTAAAVGAALFMAEKTASVHVSRILAKLGVSSRTQAAALAHRQRLT